MARFCTLYSGSSGNCTYVGGGRGGLLVDAGVSCKAILDGLAQVGAETSAIAGILITHEHVDHIRGLKVLLKKLKVPRLLGGGHVGLPCPGGLAAAGRPADRTLLPHGDWGDGGGPL